MPRRAPSKQPLPATSNASLASPGPLPKTTHAHKMTYRIARGEQGVLTFEPYKSHLLPLWRFRTPAVAQESADALWAQFEAFEDARDFVGMDMARKFLQMGMTRARRYANHKGGRKYAVAGDGGRGEELPRSSGHEGQREKSEAASVFEGYWRAAKERDGYKRLKEEFLSEQKEWDKRKKKAFIGEDGEGEDIKKEDVKVE